MFKVMIVDDEWLIRQGLRQTIPWHEMNCKLVAEACDGEEALELAREHHPDIVLSDIRMPGMDGFELARMFKEQYPEMKTIFLTGFDEFNYARQAVQLGAFDIILKPTDPEEICRVFEAAMQSISQMRHHLNYTKTLEERLKTSEPLLMEKIWFDLLMNRADEESLGLLREIWGIQFSLFDVFRVVLVRKPEEASANEFTALQQQLQETAPIPSIPVGQDSYAFIVPDSGLEKALEHGLAAFASSKAMYQGRMMISVSTAHQGILSVATAYEEARYTMEDHIGLEQSLLGRYETIMAEAQTHYPEEWSESVILDMVRWESPAVIREETHNWFSIMMKRCSGNESMLRYQLIQLLFGIYTLLIRHFWELGCLPDTKSFLDMIRQSDSPDKLLRRMEDMLCDVQAVYLLSKQQGKTEFDKVMDDINNHYDKELSIHDLASSLHMSESHFSRIFKKKIGKNFLEYITELRIKKAKDMLIHTEMRVYEVSLAVGYQDARYFSQLFRKATGETPTDFRHSFVLNV